MRDLKLHLNKAICARAVIQFDPLASFRYAKAPINQPVARRIGLTQHASTM